jgi:hypothetical protein
VAKYNGPISGYNNPLSAVVDWGDGSSTSPITLPDPMSGVVQHTYAEAGFYLVAVHISSNTVSGTVKLTVEVIEP